MKKRRFKLRANTALSIDNFLLYCERCGHEWLPRSKNKPKVCPACNSRIYDKPKKKDEDNK